MTELERAAWRYRKAKERVEHLERESTARTNALRTANAEFAQAVEERNHAERRLLEAALEAPE